MNKHMCEKILLCKYKLLIIINIFVNDTNTRVCIDLNMSVMCIHKGCLLLIQVLI